MGLFDQIVSAVNNPSQQANRDQLGSILGTVQQISNQQGLDASATQAAVSIVGNYVRSALQQKRANGGVAEAEAIVNQYGGTHPSASAIDALFTQNQQQQVAQAIQQRTGINANQVIALLPILVPIVLKLLQQGSQAGNAPVGNAPMGNAGTSNNVLNVFLDSDGDGDVDVGDAMSMAGRFLNQR